MLVSVPFVPSARRRLVPLLLLLVLLGAAVVTVAARPAYASPPTIIGFATNFDVGNGTDKECEGFEIEIEDITDTQVTYTWPGNPYGSARSKVNTTFPNGHSGVVVRYEANFVSGAWSARTPIGVVNHFGVHINGTPGVQRYSWLCDLGSSGPSGTLTPYGGTTSGDYFKQPGVAAVVPRVVSTPTGEAIRSVVIPAETPEPAEPRFPDAVFVVKYQASSPNPVDVNQLLATDPEVQSAIANSQISSIAELFQPDPGTNGGQETEPDDAIDPGDQASVTVTETYRYTGPVNPVDNEVTCNDITGDPNNCSNFVGDRIARQMVAVNFGTAANRATLNVGVTTGLAASTLGGTVSSTGTANANPGEIDCGETCFTAVDAGTVVHLTANPAPGYALQGWSGACAGAGATCDVTVNGLTSVGAIFMPDAATVFVGDASTYEGRAGTSHALMFPVVLSAAQAGTTVVTYHTVDGTATAGADYAAKSGSLSIAAGRTSGTITVTVNGDLVDEGEESLDLVIDSVTGADQGTTQATGEIEDDDTTGAPSVSLGEAAIVEGNSGTQKAVFTVTLSQPLTTKTPVQYETADGTATAGSDYIAKTGTVSIAAGSTKAKISIPVKGDTTPEGTETFRVKLSGTGSSGVATDHDNVVAKIIDDDTHPATGVSVGDAAAVEGNGGQKIATFVVTLAAPQATTTSVRYHTVDSAATANGDFVAKSGLVKILAGKVTGVISVVVNGDSTVEPTETASVLLDSAGTLPLLRRTGTLTVIADD